MPIQREKLSSEHLICPFFHQDSHITLLKATLVFTTALSALLLPFYQYKPLIPSLALFPIEITFVRQPRFYKNEVSRGQQSLPPHNYARKMLLTETSFHWTSPLSQVLSARENGTSMSHHFKNHQVKQIQTFASALLLLREWQILIFLKTNP